MTDENIRNMMEMGVLVKKKLLKIFLYIGLALSANAQTLPIPENIGTVHPRVFGRDMSVKNVEKLAKQEKWAEETINNTKNKVDGYLELYKKDPTWLVSRLQMYWNTKATQVYINGGVYSHADGEAPVPTVGFPGTRDHSTNYVRPKLADIKPYMDDPRGLYLQHKDRPDQWEWTARANTGRTIESINREIMGIARDAAFLYWYTGERQYAHLAFGILDVYLQGIYYMEIPVDLSHGHHGTLVGYSSFEVIQEHILSEITQCYDFLYNFVASDHSTKIALYAKAFQKWADLLIKNGVSFNNWNLLQAFHISKIAMVLENDAQYENGKGAQYYLDQIMNQTSTRQWAMKKLIDYGYDPKTGIWNESPGYSLNVLHDFISFAQFYDRSFDIDLIKEIPVLRQAVLSSAQYLCPNGYTVAFGDGHYKKLSPDVVLYMIENTQKYGKEEDEVYFTTMLKTLFGGEGYSEKFTGRDLGNLFSKAPLQVRGDIPAAKLKDLVSPLFYAPNTSWLVQRQGEGSTGLMISQIGSLGNHMHSNGIAMELYGHGFPLAPEMGHGSSYFSIEYAEYYTQFPAHNTVIVNGRSKYPEMKSNHAFEVVAAYPESGKRERVLPGFTFSDVTFLEPETNSDQRRVMGIVKNWASAGYYVDIFRSRQNKGKDIKHEYFYHNLAQNLKLTDKEGNALGLQPTDKLAFGDGDLMAYDYLWEKRSVRYEGDFKGRFDLKMDDRTVSMNLWMQGAGNREVFSVLSPKSTAFRYGVVPDDFADDPIPTLIVRQEGEAWLRPFVAIYEPVLNGKSGIGSVDYFGKGDWVGIQVNGTSGNQDFIFSSAKTGPLFYQNMGLEGTYGVIGKNKNDFSMFLGNGKWIRMEGYRIEVSKDNGTTALVQRDGSLYFTSEVPVVLTVPADKAKKTWILTDEKGKTYIGRSNKKNSSVSFELPELPYGPIQITAEN